MSWLNGDWQQLGTVAAKAALMYVTALIALRAGERRTLAQWTIIDFATAVAIGAIVGRTAIAGSQSFVTGAVALATLICAHRLASLLRFNGVLGKLADHRVRLLVEHGHLRRRQLRLCGLTDNDLFAELRREGVFELDRLAYVLYEAKGNITIVSERDDGRVPPLCEGRSGGRSRIPSSARNRCGLLRRYPDVRGQHPSVEVARLGRIMRAMVEGHQVRGRYRTAPPAALGRGRTKFDWTGGI